MDEKEQELAGNFLRTCGIERPFILFVGTLEPRKNLPNLIRAYHLLKAQKRFTGKLVVAGMKGWLTEELFALLKELRLEKEVRWLGFVSNQALRYLYNTTAVFVFPSFYEGFGFPLVEAFSCGAAVVTSNVSSCPEVAGDAALQVDPSHPEEIALAIQRILNDPVLKKDLQEKALRRPREFSFRKTAEQTLAVYEEVCGVGA